MTPRHPPRALGGLTTPTRPPPSTRGECLASRKGTVRRELKPPVCAAARGVVRRGGPPIFDCGATRPPLDGGGLVPPRVRREIVLATTTQTLESRCLRDQRPDCQRRSEGRRRSRPGLPPTRTSRPPPGRWPGGEAARGCPAPHPAGAEAFPTDPPPPDIAPPRRSGAGDGGARRSRSLMVKRVERARPMRPTNLGGEPAAGPPGGEGRCRRRPRPGGRIEVLESSLERR